MKNTDKFARILQFIVSVSKKSRRKQAVPAGGYAWDVIRVIPPAIITGQAAGNAAVVALDTNCGIDKVDVAKVQQRQSEQKVMLHFDDTLIPRDAASAGEKGEEIGHI